MSEVGKVTESLESFERGSVVDGVMQQNLEARIAAEAPVEFTRSPEDQETFDSLVAYYGDTQFEWGGHVGDISFVLESCPIGQLKIAQGFDAVISWADRRKVVVEEIEGEKEEEQQTEDVLEENVSTEKVEKTHKDEKPTDIKRSKDPVEKTKESQEQRPTTEVLVTASMPVEVTKKPFEEKVSVSEPVLLSTSPIKSLSEVVTEIEPVRLDNDITLDLAPVDDIAETISENELKDTIIQAEPIDDIPHITEVEIPVLASPEAHIAEVQDGYLDVDMDMAVSEEAGVDSVETVSISTERDLAIEIESWTELAEQEVPLDEFFVTVIDQLHVDTDVATDFEEVMFDEVSKIEVDSLVVVELEALIVEVQTIKSAMKKLHGATTRQECETHVDETVVALVNLLRALGYENPEKIIRDFMYAHPLSTLEELMNELELSIQRSIRYETYRQKQQSHHKRHAVFGRLVLSFLQALSPRVSTPDLI